MAQEQFETKGYAFSPMTVKVMNDFMDFAQTKGSLSRSISSDLRNAADYLDERNLQFNTGNLESLMTSSWLQQLVNMSKQFNMLESLLWTAVINDDLVGPNEKTDAAKFLRDQVEAKFEEYRSR